MSERISIVIDLPTDPEIWNAWFSADQRDPKSWIGCARDLIQYNALSLPSIISGWRETVRKDFKVAPPVHLQRVFMMIAAFSFENLLKAKMTHLPPWNDANVEGKIHSDFKTHDLLVLALRAQVELTANETELLERLKEFAIWRGRYPIPTDIEAAKPKKLRSGIITTAGSMRGSDPREAQEFTNRLISNLDGIPGREYLEMVPIPNPESFDGIVVSPPFRAWKQA